VYLFAYLPNCKKARSPLQLSAEIFGLRPRAFFFLPGVSLIPKHLKSNLLSCNDVAEFIHSFGVHSFPMVDTDSPQSTMFLHNIRPTASDYSQLSFHYAVSLRPFFFSHSFRPEHWAAATILGQLET
jgi:hypothetical protein